MSQEISKIFNPQVRFKPVFAIFIFIIVFTWMLFLTQGLPFVDPDDWDHVLRSQDTSWGLMLTNLTVPWSRSRLWLSQADMVDQTRAKRLVHAIALKSLASHFDYHFFPYYIFTKALFFAGTNLFLFLLLANMTKSLSYAIAGTMFFCVIPAHYTHNLWLSVSETMVHLFGIVCVWMYLRLAKILDRNDSTQKFWLWLVLLLMVGWLGMKTKETAAVIPLALGAFTATQVVCWKARKAKTIVLIIVLAFLAFLVVPIEHLGSAGLPTDRFNWQTIYRMVFRNYNCGYVNESTSAFFSLTDIWPVSIARTMGFFLLWTLVLLTILYWHQRFKNKNKNCVRFLEHPLISISIFWIAIELFLMSFFQADPRYFSGTLIPMTIVFVRLIYCVCGTYQNWLKKFLALLVAGSMSWGLFINLQHTIWWREQIGQKGNRFWNVARTIYQDQFPQKKPTTRELGSYYRATYIPSQPHLRDVTYYVALANDTFNKTNSSSVEEFERYAKQGAIYYATDFPPEELFNHPRIRLLTSVSGINEESWFERIIYKLKNRRPRPFYIFKYV